MAKRLPFRDRFIAAHRGSPGDGVRENTIAGFERAIALGADVIELDVRRLADDTLVVFHDGDIEHQPLYTLTRRELDRLLPDRVVPSLQEVADALVGRVQLDVELKERGTERAAVSTLGAARWTAAQFVVTSFELATLDEVRRLFPEVVTGWLTEDDVHAAIDHVTAGRVDFAAPHDRTLSHAALDACRDAGVSVVPWTVNDALRLEMLLGSPQVAGIITDRLSAALNIRSTRHQEHGARPTDAR
jgi:glycerophosphoryl diester phosphodiesterase